MSVGQPPGDDWGRRLKLAPVVLGAMAVSIGGQIEAVAPRMGYPLAVVLALTNDAGAIIALDEALKAPRGDAIRKWAWIAILLVSGTGGALNTWHVVTPLIEAPDGKGGFIMTLPELPIQLAVLVGLEPIALVLVLSHLLGLVTASRQGKPAAGGHQADRQDRQAASVGDRQSTHVVVGARPAGDRQTASPDRQAVTASPPAGERQTASTSIASPPAPTTVGARQSAGAGDRPAATPSTSGQLAVRATDQPTRTLAEVPAPRPTWMTEDLLQRVVESMATARAEGKPYGRDRVVEDHGLTPHRARTVLEFITAHNLLRRSA